MGNENKENPQLKSYIYEDIDDDDYQRLTNYSMVLF